MPRSRRLRGGRSKGLRAASWSGCPRDTQPCRTGCWWGGQQPWVGGLGSLREKTARCALLGLPQVRTQGTGPCQAPHLPTTFHSPTCLPGWATLLHLTWTPVGTFLQLPQATFTWDPTLSSSHPPHCSAPQPTCIKKQLYVPVCIPPPYPGLGASWSSRSPVFSQRGQPRWGLLSPSALAWGEGGEAAAETRRVTRPAGTWENPSLFRRLRRCRHPREMAGSSFEAACPPSPSACQLPSPPRLPTKASWVGVGAGGMPRFGVRRAARGGDAPLRGRRVGFLKRWL